MSTEINSSKKLSEALLILNNKKVALFIVAYNAEKYIEKTMSRVPKEIANKFSAIYLIDDFSRDSTFEKSLESAKSLGLENFTAMRTPYNQGYGGNQKIGYTHAINNGYDYVVMLHGDGQYPPEFLPDIIAGFEDEKISAVFGSRMIQRFRALKGGMPVYKWFGNKILTWIENKLLGTRLFEFHSGYRAYSVAALKSVPYVRNSDNFHFDTDIIVQLVAKDLKIKEISMPTHYGDEECHVDGLKYAFNCIKSVIKFRLHKIGIFYQPNFDIESETNERNYDLKISKNTLHYFIEHLPWKKTDSVADIGANDGRLSANIAPKVNSIVAVDIKKPIEKEEVRAIEIDLNSEFDKILGENKFNKVIALDIIEHLNNPEESLIRLNRILKNGGTLYASTANVAYLIMRFTLLVGWFNYGKRGILDKTHHRLFTVNSFKRLIKNNRFKIQKIIGFGPPIADQISDKGIFGLIDRIAGFFARLYPPLFSFNFLIIARKKPSFDKIYSLTLDSSSNLHEQN
jgi:2-polyprenyl-3-methyl-5-hydroxy-6-metoxy-1,4-benzoquinol methylase